MEKEQNYIGQNKSLDSFARQIATFILTVSLSLTALTTYGQTDKKKIIASFDKVEYYPDSTIKCAYKIKKGLYDGYAIEFDSTGQVSAIGKYKKGIKSGTWQFNYCSFTTYKNGQQGLISVINYDHLPEREKAKEDFKKLYLKLLNTDSQTK